MVERKTYSEEEITASSLAYFNGDELAADVVARKYLMKNEKTEYVELNPEHKHKRLAGSFAKIEKKYPNSMSESDIFDLFDRYKYIVPQGSPMFGVGNPYQMVSVSNCFVIDCVDSYGGICRADERLAQISKRRGGVGMDISPIRPKGMRTNNSSLTTDGITLFMNRFSNTIREVGQSGRRGALLLSISVHHPEIMNFITAKSDSTKVTGANISVRVTDEFMEAVKKDKKYEVRWPVDSSDPVVKEKISAKEVWDKLIELNHKSAEPGILFWDNIIRNSPADSYGKFGYTTRSTNPCLSGETLVYVADGRGDVTIRELAEKGDDVPVFCYDDKGEVTVRTMRHPRVTGHNEPIYKVTLDDGSVVRVTANHKFLTTEGEYKKADELASGDSLKILTKFEASIKDMFPSDNSRSQDYIWINNGKRSNVAEHRVIASSTDGDIKNGNVVHHRDFNAKNNSPSNLVVMSKKKHDRYHGDLMCGDNNPMRRAKTEWSNEKWGKYHDTMSEAVSGEKNGRYSGFSDSEIKEHAIVLTKQLNRRFSKRDWQSYARENGLPIEFSEWRKNSIGTVLDMSKAAANECNLKYIDEDPRAVRTLKSMEDQGYDAFIENNTVFVMRECEECGKAFSKEYNRREISFCSLKCSGACRSRKGITEKNLVGINRSCEKKAIFTMEEQLKAFTKVKFELGRGPMRKEWEVSCKESSVTRRLGTKHGFSSWTELKEQAELFNHRVISVEVGGHEKVYNGTVDDFHNFFVGGFKSKTKDGKPKSVYLNNLQCGELPLSPGSSCILMLLNLSSYVENIFTKDANFNVELFKGHVRKAMRLMDDLVDIELDKISKIIKKIEKDPESDDVKHNELSLWKEIKEACENGRRTGLGITALGDCFAMMGYKYGDKNSFKLEEVIYSTLRNEAYRESVQLAKERGPFPVWNHELEKDNEYLNRLPEDIKEDMKKHGRRNISLLTTPPAGSVSVLTQTSSGFEPVFKAQYFRKRKIMDGEDVEPDFVDETGDKWKNYKVMHCGLKKFIEVTGKTYEESPYCGSEAADIDTIARVQMQALATKYVDHSISSTLNLKEDVTIETISNLYFEAWKSGCKGLTVYRDGSRDGVLTSSASITRRCDDCDDASKQLIELIEKGQRPSDIILSTSPVRPKILKCDIQRSKVGGGDWLYFVGIINNQAYEIFGGDIKEFVIPHKYKTGWIEKNGKVDGVTQYNLILGSLEDENERLEFKGIAKHFNNGEFGAFTRLTSLAIRHGIPIKYICEQITKKGVEGDLFSFQRAMSRVLKKYISEGEAAQTQCPDCGSTDMIYRNGCPSCPVCGFSHCS